MIKSTYCWFWWSSDSELTSIISINWYYFLICIIYRLIRTKTLIIDRLRMPIFKFCNYLNFISCFFTINISCKSCFKRNINSRSCWRRISFISFFYPIKSFYPFRNFTRFSCSSICIYVFKWLSIKGLFIFCCICPNFRKK